MFNVNFYTLAKSAYYKAICLRLSSSYPAPIIRWFLFIAMFKHHDQHSDLLYTECIIWAKILKVNLLYSLTIFLWGIKKDNLFLVPCIPQL
jgi:hypothetical protein